MNTSNQRRNDIRRVKRNIEDELLALKNVHAVDIGNKISDGEDTGELSIVVYVTKKGGTIAKKDQVPTEIDGIKTDVQEEPEIVLHPALVLVDDIEIQADETTYPTLEGGMSIGPCRSIFKEPPEVATAGNYVFVGTLGAIVRDRTTHEQMMLTNFHVACVDDSWSVGDDIAQPSRVDGGSCPTDRVGAITRAVLSDHVDGAVLEIDGRPAVCEILEIGPVNGTAVAVEDSHVRKRGRTTGHTHGTVASTDYTTTIDYGDGLGSRTLYDQIRILVDSTQSTQFGNSGDSGSVVVDDNDNVIGLYFAGTNDGSLGVANPIANVLDELNVDMCTGPKLLKESVKEFTKEILKEHQKDFKERIGEGKVIKENIKELKEQPKEFMKDWKEWAYEKGDWENIDPRIPVYDPPVRTRPPIDRGRPPVRPPVRRPIGRFAAADAVPAAGGALDIDLSTYPPGNVPNPVALPGASATVLNYDGTMPTLARFVDWGGVPGLDVGFNTSVVLCHECAAVEVRLVHYSERATVEAYDETGNLVDSETMSVDGSPETLCLDGRGRGIRRLVIDAPQDETVLLGVRCTEGCRPDKPWQIDKHWPFEKPWQFEKPVQSDKFPVENQVPRQPFVGQQLRPDLRRGPLMREAN